MTTKTGPRSLWRYMLAATFLWLGLVAIVNGYMVWQAIGSFPGLAVEDDFGTSNRYDQVIAVAEAQSALRWRVTADLADGRPVLHLTGPDGAPLEGAVVTATAERPLGPRLATPTTFTEAAPGRYIADGALTEPGAWDLKLRIVRRTQTMAVTRRVIRP